MYGYVGMLVTSPTTVRVSRATHKYRMMDITVYKCTVYLKANLIN